MPASAARPGCSPPRPQELLLAELLPELRGERILCTTAGYAQLAAAAAAARPAAHVHCHFLDVHLLAEARAHLGPAPPANLVLACVADPPEDEVDLVLLPLSAGGEADLARELLQAGHERLRAGGLLAASTENKDDRWLGDQMRRIFDAVTRRASPRGTAYVARKTAPLKRRIDFRARFAFRDGGRLIEAVSRPGVFSHKKIDPGARALLEGLEVRSGARVLDIGCGSGVLSLAAALRAEGVAVHAIDSAARAVACTAEGARLNGLEARVTTELSADGPHAAGAAPGSFDLVLANPPYFASFRIAERFIAIGLAALKRGGRILIVTKTPAWYREHMPAGLADVEVRPAKAYSIVSARRLPPRSP